MFNPKSYIKSLGVNGSDVGRVFKTAIKTVFKMTGESSENKIIKNHEGFLKDTINDIIDSKVYESMEDTNMKNHTKELMESYVKGELSLDELIEQIDEPEAEGEEEMEEYDSSTDITSKTDKASQPREKKKRNSGINESYTKLSKEQFMRDSLGDFQWATLYNLNPTCRTDMKGGVVKPLYGGVALRSGDTLMEMVLDGDCEFKVDHQSQRKIIYSIYHTKSEWLLKWQKA